MGEYVNMRDAVALENASMDIVEVEYASMDPAQATVNIGKSKKRPLAFNFSKDDLLIYSLSRNRSPFSSAPPRRSISIRFSKSAWEAISPDPALIHSFSR